MVMDHDSHVCFTDRETEAQSLLMSWGYVLVLPGDLEGTSQWA